jgi:lysophospholipase L1-like esterase
MRIKLEDHHKDHAASVGHPEPPEFIEVSDVQLADAMEVWRRTYPEQTEDYLRMKAIAHLLWQEHAQAANGVPEPSISRPRNWWKWASVILFLLLLLSLFARPAHAQYSKINTIDFRNNDNSAQGFIASPFIFKAGANCGWSRSGTTMTFNCSGGSAAAGGLDTQVQYNQATALAGITNMTSDGTNVTKLTATGNIDLSGATFTRLRVAAGLTAAANGEIGYDSTNGNWHAWNGADKLLALLSGSTTDLHCVQISKTGNKVVLADAGAACGSGGGPTGKTVVFVGDSICAGSGLATPATQSWPAQLLTMSYLTGNTLNDQCVGSAQTTALASQFAPGSCTANTWVVIFMGINDIYNGTSAATTLSNLDAYIDSLHSNGCGKAFLGTLQTRGNMPNESERQAADALIRQDSHADQVLDLEFLLTNNCDTNIYQNDTFFVHPNLFGATLFARAVNAQMWAQGITQPVTPGYGNVIQITSPSCGSSVANPSISPGTNTYNNDQTITITDATSGATICYTTNGSTPGAATPGTCDGGSTTYSGTFSVTATGTVVKALGTKAANTNSSVVSATYTLTVATPADSPGAGSYGGTQSVTLSDSTTSAFLCYTTDGSTPTGTGASCTNGTHYTGAFNITTTTTLKVIGFKSNYNDSAMLTSVYTIGGGGGLSVTSSNTTACSNGGSGNVTCTVVGTLIAGDLFCVGVETSGAAPTFAVTDNAGGNTWVQIGTNNTAGSQVVGMFCTKVVNAFTTWTSSGTVVAANFSWTAGGNITGATFSSATPGATGTNAGNSVGTTLTMGSYTAGASDTVAMTAAWALGDGLTPTSAGAKCDIPSYASGPCTIGANAFFHIIWVPVTGGAATGAITATQTGSSSWAMVSGTFH